MPHRRVYLAARDHLEQADTILAAQCGVDALEARCAIRYLAGLLAQLAAEEDSGGTVVPFPIDLARRSPAGEMGAVLPPAPAL